MSDNTIYGSHDCKTPVLPFQQECFWGSLIMAHHFDEQLR